MKANYRQGRCTVDRFDKKPIDEDDDVDPEVGQRPPVRSEGSCDQVGDQEEDKHVKKQENVETFRNKGLRVRAIL